MPTVSRGGGTIVNIASIVGIAPELLSTAFTAAARRSLSH
jgi:short-subunit dehydrogenase